MIAYNVIITTRSHPNDKDIELGLSQDALETRLLQPYRKGEALVVAGRTIPVNDIDRIRVTSLDEPIDGVRRRIRASRKGDLSDLASPEDWLIAESGKDVTADFITRPARGGNARRGRFDSGKSFRARVEEHPLIVVSAAAIAAFGMGFAAYDRILHLFDLPTLGARLPTEHASVPIREASWTGLWQQSSATRGGDSVSGITRLDELPGGKVEGTFSNRDVPTSELDNLEGTLSGTVDESRRIVIGQWATRDHLSGRFRFLLNEQGDGFTGHYSIGSSDPGENPANSWVGKRIPLGRNLRLTSG